ncbi:MULTISPECIES: Uma2 family endonuclease [unclassified Nocardia]|uniref:Uma2 family endonuclease n=1 Tax=unclassified Nocardia TaxID=2637762 RepID=UPI0024A7D2C6|nr:MULTISPECIES: Uma2 family endonuclease [unclassified Nocardia]
MILDPRRLLTISDYAALPEDDETRWELQEGLPVMLPSPSPWHNIVAFGIAAQLDSCLPSDLVAVPGVDLDLRLVPEHEPATVRRPDVTVVPRSELRRVSSGGGVLRADQALLVVEVVAPGSRRADRVTKRSEYADAGIPSYWIVDPDEPVSLLPLCRTEELGYVDTGRATGTYRGDFPCDLTIDLDRLR